MKGGILNMKKLLAFVLALSLLCMGGVALADGETLVIYSARNERLNNIVIPAFEAKTGIKVEMITGSSGEVLQRVKSEVETGNVTVDIHWAADETMLSANRDLFEVYVSTENDAMMPQFQNDGTNCFNSAYAEPNVMIVNTDMLKELGVEVNGYADLLQPELVGKIASADPASSSSAFCQLTNMLLAMGGYEDDAAWKYVEDLFVGQQVAITSGSSAVYKGVYNGEYAVGLTYEDPCVTLIKDGATNIKVVYPVEGTVFLPAQIGIVKNAKNVENAKAFVDFMLSEDAQRFLAENTTSRNVREVEYKNDVMTPLADIKLIYEDSDYVIAHTSELKEKVQDIMMDM